MQIRQLQVANDQVEDRLLLRVSTKADEEFRVWLTRRLVRTIWPHLVGQLQFEAVPGGEAAAPGASFEKPFREEKSTYPLGAKPLLAGEVTFDPLPDGQLRLTFREVRERHLPINLNGELLQAFCSMLRACSEKAHWDLGLDYTATPPASPGIPPVVPPASRLH